MTGHDDQPFLPERPDLAVIAGEIQSCLFWSARLRDRFGLIDVERASGHLLLMHFSTGYIVELELRLQNPTEPK